jgi:hypothetical protein
MPVLIAALFIPSIGMFFDSGRIQCGPNLFKLSTRVRQDYGLASWRERNRTRKTGTLDEIQEAANPLSDN